MVLCCIGDSQCFRPSSLAASGAAWGLACLFSRQSHAIYRRQSTDVALFLHVECTIVRFKSARFPDAQHYRGQEGALADPDWSGTFIDRLRSRLERASVFACRFVRSGSSIEIELELLEARLASTLVDDYQSVPRTTHPRFQPYVCIWRGDRNDRSIPDQSTTEMVVLDWHARLAFELLRDYCCFLWAIVALGFPAPLLFARIHCLGRVSGDCAGFEGTPRPC